MKTLAINEKLQKKEGNILTKFLISHLLIGQEYLSDYQSNATICYFNLMGRYENNPYTLFSH